MDINEKECIKNGYYCNGEKLAKIRHNMMHYVEKYDLDIMDVCRKVFEKANRIVYSFDSVSMVDDDTLLVNVTIWENNLFDFDEIKVKR